MTHSGPAPKPSLFSRLKSSLRGSEQDHALINQQRMESFLSAMPLEYCGWGQDGMVAYSRGFCALLGLEIIHHLSDIAAVLTHSDAQLLETHFLGLKSRGDGFSIIVKLDEQSRILAITGQRGHDTDRAQIYNILWLQDITDEAKSLEALESQLAMLEKDHARLSALTQKIPVPLWLYDAQKKLSWCNDAYGALLDSSAEEALKAQKHLGLTLGKNEGKVTSRKLAQHALDEKTAQSVEGRMIVKGGRKTMQLEHFLLDQSGQHGVGGFAKDLSHEAALQSEIERYKLASTKLLENFSTAIAVFGADEKMEFYNSTFAALWEFEDRWLSSNPKLGDVMEKLRERRKLPEQTDFKAFKKSWTTMFTSLLQAHEEMLHLPDGRALRLMFAPHPLGGLMITFDDVTSRLELESSYNTLIAVQRETLDNLGEGVAVFGSDGRLKLWNPSFLKLWNFKAEALSEEPHISDLVTQMKPFFDVSTRLKTSSDHRDHSQKPSMIAWEDIQPILTAYGLERTDSKELVQRADGLYIEVAQVALPDGGVMMTYRNVTDTLRVERALREKTAALEEAERLKMDFLANVSYQLRTPLNAIMGFSEILTNEYFGELNDRQKEYSQGIEEAGQKLMRLIDNILDLSTIEAGYLSLHQEPVDVHALMHDIYSLTHDWAGKETLHVKIDVAEDIGIILADERRMKQALLNLVRNAINFTPGGGDIHLTAKRDARKIAGAKEKIPYITMAVRDTGIGIPEGDLENIFRPFERVTTYDDAGLKIQNQGGPGLGLSLVKNIVDLHGGDITIDSEMGKGTTISIVMPVYIED